VYLRRAGFFLFFSSMYVYRIIATVRIFIQNHLFLRYVSLLAPEREHLKARLDQNGKAMR